MFCGLSRCMGMVAGWLISISRFRSLTAHLLSTVYGLTWIGYLLAGPLPSLAVA